MQPLLSPRIVGAQAVVVDERGFVLLQLRLWPAGWEPPGGHVARGEDPRHTVVRETEEETGLRIEVERLTGRYRFQGIRRGTDAVFRAKAVGGRLTPTREARRLSFVDPERLPRSLFPWYHRRIQDALAEAGQGVAERVQHVGPGDVLGHGLRLSLDLASWAARRPG